MNGQRLSQGALSIHISVCVLGGSSSLLRQRGSIGFLLSLAPGLHEPLFSFLNFAHKFILILLNSPHLIPFYKSHRLSAGTLRHHVTHIVSFKGWIPISQA